MNQWRSENTASSIPPGAQNVTVFVEPDDQKAPIIDAINGATSSILLEMYELTDHEMDPNVANALVTAAKNGRTVQVLLYKQVYNSFRPPLPTYEEITTILLAGQPLLEVKDNLAVVPNIKHQKFMVIDNTAVYIMTANLSSSALGGSSEGKINREYIIRDTDAQDILALQNLFHADWNGQAVSQSLLSNTPNLVVSPINSFSMLKALIDSAQTSLYLETEEFDDLTTIGAALMNAVKRPGMQEVKLILPALPQPLSPQNQKSAAALEAIQKGGVLVKTDAFYYMHAKLIIVDKKMAFVGSQNLSTGSLGYNREVGIVVSKPDVVDRLYKTFTADWLSNPKSKPA